jgi:ribonuclease Z
MRVIFIGTAGSTPTKSRGLPSIAIEHESEIFLFDCGEGTQRQMMQYSVNISKIKAIFLTHTHGDHTLGLPGLVRTLALNKRTAPLEVYIPHGKERMIDQLINFDRATMNYKVSVMPIQPGEIYKGKDFKVSAFRLKHNTSTFGFIFKQDDKIKFVKDKAKKLGLKGEMFRTLLKSKSIKVGRKTVKLSDITFEKPGIKVVYATDTRPSAEALKAAQGADLFIHESTYLDAEKDLAQLRYHSTAFEAATIAKRAKVKKLVLTHTSARYKDSNVLAVEAKKTFKNTEIAKDGMVINL